jgi:hypothetical protein
VSRKARDYDGIIKELNAISGEMNELCRNGRRIMGNAHTAESELRDRVAKKNIDAVVRLGESIVQLASDGEERIKELINAVEKDKAEFEELER